MSKIMSTFHHEKNVKIVNNANDDEFDIVSLYLMPSFGANLLCLASLQERRTRTGIPFIQSSDVAPREESNSALQFNANALFDKVRT